MTGFSENEQKITFEEYKALEIKFQEDFWNPFFLKKEDVHYEALDNNELDKIRNYAITSESAFARKNAWRFLSNPTVEQVWEGIQDKDYNVRASVWDNSHWVPTEKEINYAFENEKSERVFAEIWDRRDWKPTREQVFISMDAKDSWVLKAVAGNDQYELEEEMIAFFIENPHTATIIWQRMDWSPSDELVEYELLTRHDSEILRSIMGRDDWERTPDLIERGLNDELVTKASLWEPYRSILENHKLKERVGAVLNDKKPGVAL